MNKKEANKIICKYMYHELDLFNLDGDYHYESLDALVPVWEKLKPICDFKFDICRELERDRWDFELRAYTGTILFSHEAETIQEAAAIATAKAIQEIKGGESDEN